MAGKLQNAEEIIEKNRLQCEELEKKIRAQQEVIRNAQEQHEKVKDSLQKMDASQATEASRRARKAMRSVISETAAGKPRCWKISKESSEKRWKTPR